MDIKSTNSIPRDAAHEYVAYSEGVLGQALGREPELKELAEFVEVAGASLLGSMYAILREHEGGEKSEAWLKKAMGTLSGTIRLRGADALVKVDLKIKDMPNRLAKREEIRIPGEGPVPHGPAPVAPAFAKCECKVSEDGSCASCFRSLAGFLGSTFKAMVDMSKAAKASESVCAVCKVKHGDEAISRIVPEILKSFEMVEKDVSRRLETASTFIVQLGMSLGLQEMPLTQAALKAS